MRRGMASDARALWVPGRWSGRAGGPTNRNGPRDTSANCRRPTSTRLRVLLLVAPDLLLQVAVLLAREEADSVQRLQLLLGACEVADLQVCLAEVFVRAPVLRGD